MKRGELASGRAEDAARDPDSPRLFGLELRAPLLVASFPEPRRTLSWAVARPGFQIAARVAWLEVRNADLTVDVDPAALLAGALARGGVDDAVAMMTSRHVDRFRRAGANLPGALADCVATVGLSNALRVALPATAPRKGAFGTINLLAAVSEPLTDVGLIEALSIATEARTAAVIDAGWRLAEGVATGTGTDCVTVAAPLGDGAATYAGLHTAIGQAIGAAVYDATLAATRDWIAELGGC